MVNLYDDGENGDTFANDGIWTAEVMWEPKYLGYAEVRVIAMDIDNRYHEIILSPPIEIISKELVISEFLGSTEGIAMSGIILTALFVVIVNLIVQKRRKKFAEMEIVESWGSVSEIESAETPEEEVGVPEMLDLDEL